MDQENFKGNERQLKLLLKAIRENDITTWNSFVKSSGKYFVANLAGINLSFLDLKEINLKGANLVGANLEGTNLERANLERAKLMQANLENTTLSNARIKSAYLKEASLKNSVAKGTNFSDSDLTYVNLDEADLENADITKTNMKFASLNKTNLKNVKKAKKTKIIPKPKSRDLTPDDKKKLSAWKIAKQEETLRRVERENRENSIRKQELTENLRAKDKLNRYIFTNENE